MERRRLEVEVAIPLPAAALAVSGFPIGHSSGGSRDGGARRRAALMLLYLMRRLAGAVVVLVALSMVVFVIFVVVPGGDPAQRIAGKNATAQGIENVRHTWGFDRPLPVQYARLMQRMVSGTLVSYTSQQNVVQQIVAGAPATFSLTIGAGVVWLLLGVAVGTFAALTAGRAVDVFITVIALVGISLPVFWLGVVVRYFLAERHGLVPTASTSGCSRARCAGSRTCSFRGSCSPSATSASTAACYAATSSTR